MMMKKIDRSAYPICARSSFFRSKCAAALAGALLASAGAVHAGDPFVAETRLFAMPWCPKNWVMAAGQIMSIQQNQALFALLGVTYGGNATTSFALPDLRGRSPVGQGSGPMLSPMAVGQASGAEVFSVGYFQMPAHSHPQIAAAAPASFAAPASGRLLGEVRNGGLYAADDAATRLTANTSATGGAAPVAHRDPFLTMTWCVAPSGIYPSSN